MAGATDCRDGARGRQGGLSPWEITATVLLIGLAHAGLLLAAQQAMSTPLPPVTPPQAIAVRWLDAPSEGQTAGPPAVPVETPPQTPPAAPPPQPVEKAQEPAPTAPQPVQKAPKPVRKVRKPVLTARAPKRPAPAQSSAETASQAAPAATPPAAAPPTAGKAKGEGAASGSTPPRVDAGYLANPAPEYPSAALRAKQQGKVLLRVLVGANGAARQVTVERSCGYACLDAAAVAAVRRWKFTPGRHGLVAVEDWVLVPIQFKLRSS